MCHRFTGCRKSTFNLIFGIVRRSAFRILSLWAVGRLSFANKKETTTCIDSNKTLWLWWGSRRSCTQTFWFTIDWHKRSCNDYEKVFFRFYFYSLFRLVWPNTEEAYSRPFLGLSKIWLVLQDHMSPKNLRKNLALFQLILHLQLQQNALFQWCWL